MTDFNKHKFLLLQILKDVYSDIELAACLGFKGGTAMMLFHDLPRLSVDLDFNLICRKKDDQTYSRLKEILAGYGNIRDEARKRFGNILVLDYQRNERNLKIEMSTRGYPDEYEPLDYLGITMKVMKIEYMLTHKLVALLDRRAMTNRDIFDCWFYMNRRVMLKKSILDLRLDEPSDAYIERCIKKVKKVSSTRILDGIGEFLDPKLKPWAKSNLVNDFVKLAGMYKELQMFE
jgi:hypothetical protein